MLRNKQSFTWLSPVKISVRTTLYESSKTSKSSCLMNEIGIIKTCSGQLIWCNIYWSKYCSFRLVLRISTILVKRTTAHFQCHNPTISNSCQTHQYGDNTKICVPKPTVKIGLNSSCLFHQHSSLLISVWINLDTNRVKRGDGYTFHYII